MPETISFRPTPHDREILERLGGSPTAAIRAALNLAERHLVEERLRHEAIALAAHPGESSEVEPVTAFMGDPFEDLPN